VSSDGRHRSAHLGGRHGISHGVIDGMEDVLVIDTVVADGLVDVPTDMT
jgi:hypothetical protein